MRLNPLDAETTKAIADHALGQTEHRLRQCLCRTLSWCVLCEPDRDRCVGCEGYRTELRLAALKCLALLFYLPFDGLTSLYLVSALFGLSQGGIVPSYALIVREYFPAREAGARVSLVLMTSVVGMAAGGWISGKIFDFTGSYQAAFFNGVAWNLLNMAIAFWLLLGRLRPRPSLA